ncbi:MAG TPA: hypothetical protein VGI73_01425 [Solirubrobacterales bacterium]|jgi:uncharacterized protein YbjT (DUF2867 family)
MADEKKITVIGATGRLGSQAVEVLRERGHEVVAASRASGVDVITGEGLGAALDGAEVIVDVATGPSPDEKEATDFFTTSAGNLQRAGAERGVGEIVAVSIVGIDHFQGGYYAAKAAHERVHRDGSVPTRLLRATQFHEFVAELVKWSTQDGTAYLAPMRTQLIAARAVAEGIADLLEGADGRPLGNPVSEIAGPREETLAEVAKLLVAKRGEEIAIESGDNPDDPEGLWPGGGLLPGPIAKLAGPTFEEWLNA